MSLFTQTAVPDTSEFLSDDFLGVCLFSGIGLLVSLVAVLCDVQGVWL